MNNLKEWKDSGIQLINALRVRGEEEAFRRLLSDLYPDKAHFIYELFQNAQDAKAEICRFTLSESDLEFEHNGTSLFSEGDVKSITSFGNSTKRDAPTSIGKFGVGFKAVFAYTDTPEIHSGDFHFQIHDLVVPETDGVQKTKLGERETRFVFPFNNPKKPESLAVKEVERGLRDLGDNTLLFLSHIQKIEYILPDGSLGSLERINKSGGHIEIRAIKPGGEEAISHWLRFEKDVEVTDEDNNTKMCRIAIAYSIAEKKDKKGLATWEIIPLDRGQVSIYFPADKETSNLRFHIHAPFASTVARDSVRDCEANNILRNHIADLVVESLATIRDQGLLNVGFLAVLPNPQDNLPDFYEPIRKAIVDAFKSEPLTPTMSGSHAPARELYRGPAQIQKVLDDDDLVLLLGEGFESPLWASNPPQRSQREDKFLESINITEWEFSELTSVLDNGCYDDDLRERIEAWIKTKDDAWVMNFYALLGEACDTYSCLCVENYRIARVESGLSHEHVLPKDAFFPPDQEVTPPPGIHFMKRSVFSTTRNPQMKINTHNFLSSIGVRPFDERAIIDLKLKYYDDQPEQFGVDYYKDLKQFIAYWKKSPTDAALFKTHKFLRGENEDGTLSWYQPKLLCMDTPYQTTGLAELTSIHGNQTLWAGYTSKLTESQPRDFIDFLRSIGVMDELSVTQTSLDSNPKRQDLWKNLRSARDTYTGISEDYSIEEMNSYTKLQSVSASRLIWQALIKADPKVAKARYRPNQQYQIREVDSQLVQHLKLCEWIPDKSGAFHRPRDISSAELRTDFPFDNRNNLLTAIGFGERARMMGDEYQTKNEKAIELGYESIEELEKWKKVKETGISPDEFLKQHSQNKSVLQPEGSVPNPERRRNGVLERSENAPAKESITRERSIQPDAPKETLEAKAYLRAKYKNAEGQLICQCCHSEMPFKVGDEHFFEAVQCVRRLKNHYFENRLALCPNCAAMYQYARDTDDSELCRLIVEHSAGDQASSVEIPIRLAGREFTLHFVGTHWFDLKTILGQI